MESIVRVSKEMRNSNNSKDVNDFGKFDFWNGDRYEGQYLAVKQPLTIARHGKGIYYANDESIYAGTWARDILDKAEEIVFPDNSKFVGLLDNMVMEGYGTYTFQDGVKIYGYLTANQFLGELELTDPTGHIWKTGRDSNEYEVIFEPIQTFWSSIKNNEFGKFSFEQYGEEEILMDNE